jgi:hypothetical protein
MKPTAQQPVLDMKLPEPHILSRMVDANETYFLASRGSFKTTRGISLFVIHKVYQMPRSSGVIVGLSFEHLGDNTIPPLLHSWAEFGLNHGEHYVYGVRPPDHWPKPYLGVINGKFDHTITFHNGTVIHLVSLKKKASANGISAQWGVFDEAKFMKEKVLKDEIFPIFRGNEKYFKRCSGYLAKFFATDKLADPAKIKWLLKKRELNNPVAINVVITLQAELSRIRMELAGKDAEGKEIGEPAKGTRFKLLRRAHELEVRLMKLRSGMTYYVEASGKDVVPILGEKWLKDKERNLGEHEYKVAILNKDPDRAGESFYPDFSLQEHTYRNPFDINPVKPFIIAADYQHSIAPILVAQLCKLPGADDVTLNYVDEVYLVGKQLDKAKANGNGGVGSLSAAVQLFCDRYKNHPTKRVVYVYDHTAIGRRVDADKYFEIVTKVLKKNKWSIRLVYTGQAPLHFQKFEDTKAWMARKDDSPIGIMINAERCDRTIQCVQAATATTIGGKTEKDKRNEKDESIDQSTTTHITDVFDQINDAVLKQRLIKPGGTSGMGARMR